MRRDDPSHHEEDHTHDRDGVSARTPRQASQTASRTAPRATKRTAKARRSTPTAATTAVPTTPAAQASPEESHEASDSRLPATSLALPTSALLLTPAEAARMLRINRSTLYPLLMRGEIPSIRIGRARRIPVSALTQWIAKQVSDQQSQDGPGGSV